MSTRRAAGIPRVFAGVALVWLAVGPMRAQSVAVAPAASVLSILVLDELTDAPLPNVRVTMFGRPEGMTDARGRFTYLAPAAGRVIVLLNRLGYEVGSITVDLAARDTMRVSYAMSRIAQQLDSVTVVDKASRAITLQGFEKRLARHDGGTFFNRDEIERLHPVRTTDLLRRVTSLTVWDSAGILLPTSSSGGKFVWGSPKDISEGNKMGGKGGPMIVNCVMRVAVDGQLKQQGFVINDIPPQEIHGIELYGGPATMPAEFGGMRQDVMCGIVMVWTRVDK
jgi:hypothetical protein